MVYMVQRSSPGNFAGDRPALSWATPRRTMGGERSERDVPWGERTEGEGKPQDLTFLVADRCDVCWQCAKSNMKDLTLRPQAAGAVRPGVH